MKFAGAVIFALAFLTAFSSAQLVEKRVLDAFDVPTSTLLIVAPESDTFDPITKTASTQSSQIIGGERDIRLTLQEGELQIVTAFVNSGDYTVSTSSSGRGFASLVYDGTDNDGFNIDPNGLNLNLADNGATALRVEYSVDVDSSIELYVYSGSTSPCASYTFPVEGTGTANTIQRETVEFGQFSGNCDFTNIGAVELRIPLPEPVDFVVTTLLTVGVDVSNTPSPSPIVVAPSASRTPAAGVSASRTPAPIEPSATRTPGASPSPTPSPSPSSSPEVVGCECNCPAFRCGLVYAVPGDDDDNVDDDTHDDDDIIYRPVYYGPVDDDFDGIDGDDDEFELISRMGGLTIYHNDDDDDNSAGLVSFSLFLLGAALMLI